MPLRILNVAYPFAPVGPAAVGGAEQVLTAIDEALVRANTPSFVIGCDGSITAGRRIEAFALPTVVHDDARAELYARYRSAIESTIRSEQIDVVHYHGVDFYRYLANTALPQLATLHLPPDWYPPEIYSDARVWLHCVSDAQHQRCPRSERLLDPIPNGVHVRFRNDVRKRRLAVSLGRICPEKGYEHAIEAARKSGLEFLLAGQVFPYEAHERYFSNTLRPLLDKHRRFIGPVGPRNKARLLTAASCLLVPSLVAETSSLVAMEALTCGTPVIAFPSGALPSLIVDGVTGFIVRNADEMAEAIRAAASLSPEACRAYAREHFSAERMTARYLQLYATLVERTRAGVRA